MKPPPLPGARLVASRADVDAAHVRLTQAAQEIVAAGNCVLLGVLLGGLVPLARIIGGLEGDFEFDTCRVGRYGDAMTGGELRWLDRPKCRLDGRHVVVVDDIFDEGVTLEAVIDACRLAGARQVTSLVLVRKRHQRSAGRLPPDLVGIEADDLYLFGAGMDHQGKWRHLPDIWGVPSTG